MGKKADIEVLKEQPLIYVNSRFKGRLKKLFIQDLERGEKPADLLRQMANVFYEQKEFRAKHGY